MMGYTKPEVVRFGTFRELTRQSAPNGKKDPGLDLANAFGTSCNFNAAPGSAASCTQGSSARG